jgi:hypothetical protein
MVLSIKFNYYQEKIFDFVIIILYILVFASFLGVYNNASAYLNTIDYYFRIYICLFLIWRFNPFRNVDVFTNLDRKIAFNAGMFILTTTVLNNYIDKIKNKVDNNRYLNYFKTSIDSVIKPKSN